MDVKVATVEPPPSVPAMVAAAASDPAGRVLRLFVPVTEKRAHRVALGERSLAEELARSVKDKLVRPHEVIEVVITLPEGYVVAGGAAGGEA